MMYFLRSREKQDEAKAALDNIKSKSETALNATEQSELHGLRDNYNLKLKQYESFRGRINFNQFQSILNFEENIYRDKRFEYSAISNYDKRFIPEYMAGALATVFESGLLQTNFRAVLEQYMMAMMSDMDYHNYANIEMLRMAVGASNKRDCPSYFYVMGICPPIFDAKDYIKEINVRIEKAVGLWGDVQKLNKKQPLRIFLKNESNLGNYLPVLSKHYGSEESFKRDIEIYLIDGYPRENKLTKQNVQKIFENIPSEEEFNLIVITSTFHVAKTAKEIEKYLFTNKNREKYLQNIFVVGTEKFYTLFDNTKSYTDEENKRYHIRKMQSFLFEVYLHALDRNTIK